MIGFIILGVLGYILGIWFVIGLVMDIIDGIKHGSCDVFMLSVLLLIAMFVMYSIPYHVLSNTAYGTLSND